MSPCPHRGSSGPRTAPGAPRSEGPAPLPQPPRTPGPLPAPRGRRGSPLPCGHPRDTEPRSSPGLTGFQQGAQGERQQHGGVAAHDRGSGASPGLFLPSRVFQQSSRAASGAVSARQVLYSRGPARHPLRPRGTPGSAGRARSPRSSLENSSSSSAWAAPGEWGQSAGQRCGEGGPCAECEGSEHSGGCRRGPPRSPPHLLRSRRCFELHKPGRIQGQSQVFP